MWFIINNGNIDKVSETKENENQIEILNCPDEILVNPSKYVYLNEEFIENMNFENSIEQ